MFVRQACIHPVALTLLLAASMIAPALGQARPARPTKPKAPPSAKSPTAPSARARPVRPAAEAQHAALNLQFVTDEPIAAVVVRPQRLFSSPLVQLLPIEVVEIQAQEQMGVDLRKLEELLVTVSVDESAMPSPVVVARFSEPVDQESVAGHFAAPVAAEKPDALRVAFPDSQTVVVARAGEMQAVLTAQGDGASPLLERLRRVESATAVSAVVMLETLRGPLAALLGQFPFPPPLDGLAAVPDMLTAVEFHARLGDAAESTLVFECRDAAAAEKLNKLLDQAIAFANQVLDIQIAQGPPPGGDPTQQAMLRYSKRLLNQIVELIDRRQAESRVTLRMEGQAAAAPAVAGALAGLLLPAVGKAREAARRSQSTNNLKMIAIACHNFHDVYNRLPTSTFDKEGKPLLSWRVYILPFVEEQNLYQQFHLDEPWDSEHNRTLIARMPQVYRSPDFPHPEKTVYLASSGPGALFPLGDKFQGEGRNLPAVAVGGDDKIWANQIRFADITDGTSNTILAVEADPERAVIWSKPDDLEFDPEMPAAGLGGLHDGRFNALFCDGSVHFLSTAIPADTLRALFDYADGKPIDWNIVNGAGARPAVPPPPPDALPTETQRR